MATIESPQQLDREKGDSLRRFSVLRLYWPWWSGLAVGGTLFLLAALCIGIAWSAGDRVFKEEFRDHLVTLARVAAAEIDADTHRLIVSPSQ